MKVKLIIRKGLPEFNSIEKVFFVLNRYLKASIIKLPCASKGLINRIKNISFLLKHRSDLIHVSGHDNYLLSFPFFKKSILTIHDVEGVYKYKGIKKIIFKKLWIDWPIKNASQVTTISSFSKDEICNILGKKVPIRIIENPLSLEVEFKPKVFQGLKPKILQIGTKANKNIYGLIGAIKGIKCELIIIGQYDRNIEIELDKNKIDYTFKSHLSNAEMIQEYYESDILAFVSTYEGFGLPIIEAQAMGRVVLTSNVASMPEVAGDGALLVDPYSVESIRNGINRLLEDASLREDLIQKGKENVKRFEPKLIAELYQELYRELGGE